MFRPALTAAVALALVTAAPAADLPGYRSPEGWDVRVAASEPLVVNPVTMTFGDDGRLYVAEWKAGRGPNDLIKVLTDTDGDGAFDRADVFMDKLDLPAGILFWDGWLYLTLDHDVVRLKDKDGDGKYEVREVIASGFGNDDSHHRVSGMTMGPDGWLYLTTGDSDAHARGSDGSTATVLRCGGVFRCRPDGSHMENVAFGMRNPWGNVAFDSAFHIVHTDNDNEGAPGFTGCRMLHVVDGGDYGWRLREGARCCAPDYERATWNGGRPGRLGWMAETGRGAPAGLCVLNSPAFPLRLQDLVIYPDVFRKSVRAYQLAPTGATFRADERFVLLGSDEGLFRPTDAEVGPDGALYLLDWRTDSGGAGQLSGNGQTGRIYRVTWGGTKDEPRRPTLPRDRFVALRNADVDQLLAHLDAASDAGLRRAASLELIRRGPKAVPVATLQAAVDRLSNPTSKMHALGVLFALHETEALTRATLAAATLERHAGLSRFAFELLGRLEPTGTDDDDALALLAVAGIERPAPGSDAPQVRRAAALALGRFGRGPRQNDADGKAAEEALRRGRSPEELSKLAARLRDRALGRTVPPLDPKDRVGSPTAVAAALLRYAANEAQSEAFLRDGFTRGIERLGPDVLPTLVKAVASRDKAQAKAALFTLEGLRDGNAAASILSVVTSDDEGVSEDDKVVLLKTLRELVADVPADPVARWLEHDRAAGPKARAEGVKLLSAMHAKGLMASQPVLPALLRDPAPEVERAALDLAREVRSDGAREALIEIVRSEARTGERRALALAALRTYDGLDLAPLVRQVAPKADDPALKLELIRTLAPRDFTAAAAMAQGLLDDPRQELRQEAIALLGSRPQTALVVARRYLDGKLPAEDLSRVIDAARPHASPELQTVLRELLKKAMVAAPEGRRLREFVGRHGNPGRGKAIFLDAKKGNCATCHRLEGVGGSVGPDLTRIWETLSFEKRVESILEPSKEIKEGFGTFKVATVDGRVLTGLLLGDTPEGVTLKDAEGRERRIPKKDIDEKGPDKTSLMPEGVVGHLSLNELADLLAFLGDRQAQEGLRTDPPAGSSAPTPGQ